MNPRDFETVNEVVAEMREMLAAYEKSGLWPKFGPSEIRHYADRLDAAAEREREAYNIIISGCASTAGELAKERDRAVQYANAAPHPGSASWKEIQSDARKVATLRDSLVEIIERTNREKARDYDAALNGGILEIHDIANTAINQTKGE